MSALLGRLLVADMVMATEYMMAEIQKKYTDELLTEWRSMISDYYIEGYDVTGGKLDKTTRELQELVGVEYLTEEEFKIRDKIWGDDC